jgi:putative SOS response-associated peptidase YedK
MSNPGRASGSCQVVSDAYYEWLRSQGEKRVARTLYFVGDVEHHVVRHNGIIVDWTYRQFDPDAPVPIIESQDKYLQRTDF